MAVDVPAARPVPDGPLAYRSRLRRLGPLMALAVPFASLVLAAMVSSGSDCEGRACAVKGGVVYLLMLCGLPTALLAGLPWDGGGARYLLTFLTSAALWAVIGAFAAFRATQAAVASWRDWWREYLLLAAGVWAGVVVALAIVAVALGALDAL